MNEYIWKEKFKFEDITNARPFTFQRTLLSLKLTLNPIIAILIFWFSWVFTWIVNWVSKFSVFFFQYHPSDCPQPPLSAFTR